MHRRGTKLDFSLHAPADAKSPTAALPVMLGWPAKSGKQLDDLGSPRGKMLHSAAQRTGKGGRAGVEKLVWMIVQSPAVTKL